MSTSLPEPRPGDLRGETTPGRGEPRRVVRPYVLTAGRTRSSLGTFELHAPVLALIASSTSSARTPRRRTASIVELCQTPMSVAELVGPPAHAGGRGAGARRRPGGRAHGAGPSDRGRGERDVRLLERLLEGIRAL